MKTTIFAVIMMAATFAQADGFVCKTHGGLTLKVYNHTQPSEGTRNAAVLVVSDDSVQHGRKTIARFTDVSGLLTQDGTNYEAKVDLRFNDSGRKGEWIAGTKLGELATIGLFIEHNYLHPLADGEETLATMLLEKRNGEVIYDYTTCVRYLKLK